MTSRPSSRRGVRVRAALAVIAAALAVLTAALPDWIEKVLGVSPDAGGGGLEWVIALAFVLLAIFCGASVRDEHRRRARAEAGR